MSVRHLLAQQVSTMIAVVTDLPGPLLDYDVQLPSATWVAWKSRVSSMELDVHRLIKADVVIPTVDTIRHESLLYSLLSHGSNVILCGPVIAFQ